MKWLGDPSHVQQRQKGKTKRASLHRPPTAVSVYARESQGTHHRNDWGHRDPEWGGGQVQGLLQSLLQVPWPNKACANMADLPVSEHLKVDGQFLFNL